MKCNHCFVNIDINAKFCPYCGKETTINREEKSSDNFQSIKDFRVQESFSCQMYRQTHVYYHGHHRGGGYTSGQNVYLAINGDTIYIDYLDGNVDSFPLTSISKSRAGVMTAPLIIFLFIFVAVAVTMTVAMSEFSGLIAIFPSLIAIFAASFILPLILSHSKAISVNTREGVIHIRFHSKNDKRRFFAHLVNNQSNTRNYY